MERIDFDQPLVVDGAMATELEKLGVKTDTELWSAMALIHDPQAVVAVHKRYFEVGANVAITDSYQANVPAFEAAGLTPAEGRRLITESVKLAQQARDTYLAATKTKRPLWIAGSVGPYGAYLADGSEYTGNYQLSRQQYQNFHRERMQLLAAAGVDLFAFETQPNFEEAKALVALLENEFSTLPAWVSFSVDQQGRLCDGTSLSKAVAYFEDHPQVVAIGVNCTAMTNIEKRVKTVATVTTKPIVVYPNNGDTYDPASKTWQVNPAAPTFSELVPKWLAAGASLIGGCCRTTPEDIQQVAKVMLKH
ncbi:homocysteine S-methyltransferase [Secundilactobacillus mixtipabuli]|uniref:S-methylmethionine:homocysteine methyltransferase n=1 Tax=Secundilactobacillus mixtipabuli TaxID=1435342 RepID=A0A1Z5IDS9_9LACO|nr:homocysteine S-methyltransferase [Secundilactobacillus mixtipabuli]GAW99771.1 homocysteine S-methyltransferase [Secundilactobacillus mixtipabuli]